MGLFGGSYDPPHGGHLAMACRAREARELDHVVWVPAARPPHKPGRILAGAAERLDMLQCLLGEREGHSIWTLELEREGASYTIDTARSLRAALPADCQLFLILGSDNLPGLPGWREAQELLEICAPIVLPRAGHPAQASDLQGLTAAQRERVLQGLVEQPPIEISSTQIREALAGAKPRPAAVPLPMWEYLTERGLYAK